VQHAVIADISESGSAKRKWDSVDGDSTGKHATRTLVKVTSLTPLVLTRDRGEGAKRITDVLAATVPPPGPPQDPTATSAQRVLRAISNHVVSVEQAGVGEGDSSKNAWFPPWFKVDVEHLAFLCECRDVYPVYGASRDGQVHVLRRVTDLSKGCATVLLPEPCEWLTLCVVRERYVPTLDAPLVVNGPHGVVVSLPEEARELQSKLAIEMVGNVRGGLAHVVSPVVELFPHIDFEGKFEATVTLPHCLDFGKSELSSSSVEVCCRYQDGRVEPLDSSSIIAVTQATVTFVTTHFGEWMVRLTLAMAAMSFGLGASRMLSPTPLAPSPTRAAEGPAVVEPLGIKVEIIPAVKPNDTSTLVLVARRREYGNPTADHLKARGFDVCEPLQSVLRVNQLALTAKLINERSEVLWTSESWTPNHDPQDEDACIRTEIPLPREPQASKCQVTLRRTNGDGTSHKEQRVIELQKSVLPQRPAVEIAVFFSGNSTASHTIWNSLMAEIKILDGHCKSGKVSYALDHRVDHSFATVEALNTTLTLLSGRRAASTPNGQADLVLQFIGHGQDGNLVFDAELNVQKMAVVIASCRPTCVIFNACESFDIAQAVHLECKKKQLSTVVGFWHTRVVNMACEMLSKSLLPYVGGWNDALERGKSSVDAFLRGIGLARDMILADEEMKKMFPCRRHMPELGTLPYELPLPDPCECAACAASSGGLEAHVSDTDVGSHDAAQQSLPVEFGICEPDDELDSAVRGHRAPTFKPTEQLPLNPREFAVEAAQRFLADFTKNVCALYVVGKYFNSPVPSREFWYQVSQEYYDWLMSPVDALRPPGLACPPSFDVKSTVPYVVVHVHFLSRRAEPDQPNEPDFDRVGSVNLRWSKGVDFEHLKKGGDPINRLTPSQVLFLGSWLGCVRTGRLNNPYALPAQAGAMPQIRTREDMGGGGRNVSGKHNLARDPPGTLGHGWRQVDVVEFSTRHFSVCDGRLLRAFEKVYELPERVCCFDDDVVPGRFRIKIDWAKFPAGNPPRYTRRIWHNPTAHNLTPNDVVDPPYFTDVRRTLGYKATALGWKYKDVTKPIPPFGAPLPPHGRLGAVVSAPVEPAGLRSLLIHAEAERAKRSRNQPRLNYAEYSSSTGSWEGDRFVPGKVSRAKFANRGGSASADAAAAASAD
jgi:hypothetical protein